MPYFNEPNDCRGWWTSRSGLEQKLIILSTILFIVCFALTITVIVYKNRSSSGDCTTIAPPITGSTSVTGDTSSDSTVVSSSDATTTPSQETSTSPIPESSSTSPTQENSPTPSIPKPSTTPPTKTASSETPKPEEKAVVPIEKSESSPLIALLKETNRMNNVLENFKEEKKLRGP